MSLLNNFDIAENQTSDGWVQSVNATYVQCHPPTQILLTFDRQRHSTLNYDDLHCFGKTTALVK